MTAAQALTEHAEADRNVTVAGLGFLLLFTAYNTAQNYLTTVLGEDGYTALTLIYSVFAVSNAISPAICAQLGLKNALVAGGSCYIAFMLALGAHEYSNGHLKLLVLCAAAANGFGAAVLWTALGSVISIGSSPDTLGSAFGQFWGLFQSSTVVGNLLAVFIFSANSGADTLLFFVFAIIAALGCAVFLMLHPIVTPSCPTSVLHELQATVALALHPQLLQLSLFQSFCGFMVTYQTARFPLFVDKVAVGVIFMIFGIAEVTGAMAAGALYDAQHHRLYLFLMFFLIILPFAMCVGLELNSTSSIGMHDAEIMLPMVAAALFGLADSMASVCAYALVAELFEGQQAVRAMAVKTAQTSLGVLVGFILGPSLGGWLLLIEFIWAVVAFVPLVAYYARHKTSSSLVESTNDWLPDRCADSVGDEGARLVKADLEGSQSI